LRRDLDLDAKLGELRYRGARRTVFEDLVSSLGADTLIDRVRRYAGEAC
jgi:hypothetical protein